MGETKVVMLQDMEPIPSRRWSQTMAWAAKPCTAKRQELYSLLTGVDMSTTTRVKSTSVVIHTLVMIIVVIYMTGVTMAVIHTAVMILVAEIVIENRKEG